MTQSGFRLFMEIPLRKWFAAAVNWRSSAEGGGGDPRETELQLSLQIFSASEKVSFPRSLLGALSRHSLGGGGEFLQIRPTLLHHPTARLKQIKGLRLNTRARKRNIFLTTDTGSKLHTCKYEIEKQQKPKNNKQNKKGEGHVHVQAGIYNAWSQLWNFQT